MAYGVADGFTDARFEVPEFYFEQAMVDGRLMLRYGQGNPDQFFDSYSFRTAKRSFLNQAFAANPAVGFPGYGLGASALLQAKSWDLTIGAYNILSDRLNERGGDWSFNTALFGAIQIGWDFDGLDGGAARIQAMAWHADAAPEFELGEGDGISIILEQAIAGEGGVFARVSWADGEATGINGLAEIGAQKNLVITAR